MAENLRGNIRSYYYTDMMLRAALAGMDEMKVSYYQEAFCLESLIQKLRISTATENKLKMKQFKCDQCPKVFTRSTYLKNHRRLHTGRGYKCGSCSKVFTEKWDLTRHEFTHTDKRARPFPCNQCDKRYCDKKSLVLHVKLKHGKEEPPTPLPETVCEFCGLVLMKSSLVRHKRMCHNFRGKNEKCAATLGATYDNHAYSVSGNQHSDHTSVVTEKSNESGSSLADLTVVKVVEARLGSSDEKTIYAAFRENRLVDKSSKTGTYYICRLCGQRFRKTTYFNLHMKRNHSKEEDKKLICQYCGRGFPLQHEMKQHLKIHMDLRPYHCKICGKRFKQVGHIRVHMTSHMKRGKFRCRICRKVFKHRGGLMAHIVIHSNFEPFKCPLCNEKFKSFGLLLNHCLKAINNQGQTIYTCHLCFQKFGSIPSLQKHLKCHREKPFVCSICKESFSNFRQLYCHKDSRKHFTADDVEDDSEDEVDSDNDGLDEEDRKILSSYDIDIPADGSMDQKIADSMKPRKKESGSKHQPSITKTKMAASEEGSVDAEVLAIAQHLTEISSSIQERSPSSLINLVQVTSHHENAATEAVSSTNVVNIAARQIDQGSLSESEQTERTHSKELDPVHPTIQQEQHEHVQLQYKDLPQPDQETAIAKDVHVGVHSVVIPVGVEVQLDTLHTRVFQIEVRNGTGQTIDLPLAVNDMTSLPNLQITSGQSENFTSVDFSKQLNDNGSLLLQGSLNGVPEQSQEGHDISSLSDPGQCRGSVKQSIVHVQDQNDQNFEITSYLGDQCQEHPQQLTTYIEEESHEQASHLQDHGGRVCQQSAIYLQHQGVGSLQPKEGHVEDQNDIVEHPVSYMAMEHEKNGSQQMAIHINDLPEQFDEHQDQGKGTTQPAVGYSEHQNEEIASQPQKYVAGEMAMHVTSLPGYYHVPQEENQTGIFVDVIANQPNGEDPVYHNSVAEETEVEAAVNSVLESTCAVSSLHEEEIPVHLLESKEKHQVIIIQGGSLSIPESSNLQQLLEDTSHQTNLLNFNQSKITSREEEQRGVAVTLREQELREHSYCGSANQVTESTLQDENGQNNISEEIVIEDMVVGVNKGTSTTRTLVDGDSRSIVTDKDGSQSGFSSSISGLENFRSENPLIPLQPDRLVVSQNRRVQRQRAMVSNTNSINTGMSHQAVSKQRPTKSDSNEKKRFICEECNKTFEQKKYLKRHAMTHLPASELPHQCARCSRGFDRPSALERHMRIHLGAKPYVCDICSKQFTQQGHLITHKRMHNKERPFACCVCKKSFITGSQLRKHSLIHGVEKKLECNICYKKFHDKASLQRHSFAHTDRYGREKILKQMNTLAELDSDEMLNIHSRSFVKQIISNNSNKIDSVVSECKVVDGYKEIFSDNVNKTDNEAHRGSNEDGQNSLETTQYNTASLIESDDSVYGVGNVTNRQTSEEADTSIKKIQSVISTEKNVPDNPVKSKRTVNSDRSFMCGICGKQFSRHSNVKLHMKRHENETNEKTFFCDICSRGYANKTLLKEHTRVHGKDEKLFQCHHCEVVLQGRKEFERHNRLLHSRSYRFLCKKCGQKCKTKQTFFYHLAICCPDVIKSTFPEALKVTGT